MNKFFFLFLNAIKAFLSKFKSDFFTKKFIETDIDKKEKKILKNLKKNGYYILEDFLSKNICDKIIKRIDFFLKNNSKFFFCDKQKSDYRIWGSENIFEEINSYFNNQFLRKIGQSFFSKSIVNYLCLANRVFYKKNNLGSGGGWHRDSFGSQYKTILYLNAFLKIKRIVYKF